MCWCVRVCWCVCCVCVLVCVCVREGSRPSRDPSSLPSRGFKGLPSETLKGNPSRLHLCALLPSLVVDTIRFEPPPQIWSPLPSPRLTLNCYFVIFLFFFSAYFFLAGSFFLFWSPVPLFFCLFFFFGRLCPVLVLGEVCCPNQTVCQCWRVCPKGVCPIPVKVRARRLGAELWKTKFGGLKGGGPKGGEVQNIAFFTLSRRKCSLFASLSGGLLVEFLAAVQGCGPPKMHVWASLGSCCASPEEETLKLFKG